MKNIVRLAFSLLAACTFCAFLLLPAHAEWVPYSLELGAGDATPGASHGANLAGNEIHAVAHVTASGGTNASVGSDASADAFYNVTWVWVGSGTPTSSFTIDMSEVAEGDGTEEWYGAEHGIGYASDANTTSTYGPPDYNIHATYALIVNADPSDPYTARATFQIHVSTSVYAIVDVDAEDYYEGQATANASVSWGLPR